MNTLIEHGILFSGIWENEGHVVQFIINDDDSVEINEQLHSNNKTHSCSIVCNAASALEKQQVLLKFGYDHYELTNMKEVCL
tara:strand:- start:59 stop:304 length:246 start_codon:yes stop_codon:yes gene_type:complete